MHSFDSLLQRIRACRLCEKHLPQAPNPILRAHPDARLLVVGQAPGIRAHRTNTPWNDPSGERLRQWLQIDNPMFYDEKRIAIIPMGYCYPGTGATGDYPPQAICSKTWLSQLLQALPNIKLTLLVGRYAQAYYLKQRQKSTLTETVRHYADYLPHYFPLPHPSPRNNRWLAKNPWFLKSVIPVLQEQCQQILKQ